MMSGFVAELYVGQTHMISGMFGRLSISQRECQNQEPITTKVHSLSKTGKGNLDAQSPTMPSDTRATQISTNQSQFETTEANYTPHSQIVTRLSFEQTHNTSHVRKKSAPLPQRRYGDGWWYLSCASSNVAGSIEEECEHVWRVAEGTVSI